MNGICIMRFENDDWSVIFTVFLCKKKVYKPFMQCLEKYGFYKDVKSIPDIIKYYGNNHPSRYMDVFELANCQELRKSFPTYSWYAINNMWWKFIQTQIFKQYI